MNEYTPGIEALLHNVTRLGKFSYRIDIGTADYLVELGLASIVTTYRTPAVFLCASRSVADVQWTNTGIAEIDARQGVQVTAVQTVR